MKTKPMSWNELCGKHTLMAIRTDVTHPFDKDANGIAIDLDNELAVFIFEDPSDGYRSTAAAPLIANCNLYEFGCKMDYIKAPVTITRWTESDSNRADGIILTDTRNGKVILRVGTENTDDDYPRFVCDWRPQDLGKVTL